MRPLGPFGSLFSTSVIFVISLFSLVIHQVLGQHSGTATSSNTGSAQSVAPSASGNASSENSTRPLGTRAHHGLPREGMQVNSIYFGVLPDWNKENAIDINKALGAKIALIGDYIYIGSPNTSQPFIQMEWHSDSVIRLSDSSIYAPAIIPDFPLTEWTDDLTQSLVEEAAVLNGKGVTVWLRFAYEMNGYWMKYGLDPETYINVWQSLYKTLRENEGASDTYLLWSPNIASGDVDGDQGYSKYYPGEDYVDIAGLSYYWTGPEKQYNAIPDKNAFIKGFGEFNAAYGSQHPLVISETSASFHYEIPDGYDSQGVDTEVYDIPDLDSLTAVPSENSPSEVDMKMDWLDQLMGSHTAGRFPNLTAVSWFNYFKEQNHSQFQDYRCVGGKSAVEEAFRKYVGNITAYQGGFDGAAVALHTPRVWFFILLAFEGLIHYA